MDCRDLNTSDPVESKLAACKRARSIAAESLATVLGLLLRSNRPISEVMLRDQWLADMRKHREIYPDGWYDPPAHGVAVLFATDDEPDRVNFHSLRPADRHPRDDVELNVKSGIMYCFASPVDRRTGMIGDFGISLYLGEAPHIQRHLYNCLHQLNKGLADHAGIGMSLKDLFAHSRYLMKQMGVTSNLGSITNTATALNPTGDNIGHTIPASDRDWTSEEWAVLCHGEADWPAVCKTISNRRIFIDPNREVKIAPGMLLTIEPRPQGPDVPMAGFHTIIAFGGDAKHWLTDFDRLFQLTGMTYMLDRTIDEPYVVA